MTSGLSWVSSRASGGEALGDRPRPTEFDWTVRPSAQPGSRKPCKNAVIRDRACAV